ncbi:ankyrin containing protein (ISS) [Seminavis robusta]|uniref:Ankyrin containing protein (ISS) n=1 Tax=Seminavis robusta TaxID=568900 RepID=A0A9N8ESM7_9STRA|nr:ankyrin containing protein (ISS) [Seminavis robusta]|eukprot:Sro1829_g300250.1 ankyrin containing protein (ISS) (212) ;mRNA; f:11267-11902
MSSDSIDNTNTNTVATCSTNAAAATNSSANNNKKQKMSPPVESLLLDKAEIWIQGILPCVGIGQYGFLGAVNKKMNQLYKEYCKIELEKKPRRVKDNPGRFSLGRYAEITDTLYSETFCNQPHAEHWLKHKYSSNNATENDRVCNKIAKIGSLTIMLWAKQEGFPWSKWTCAWAARNGHLEMFQWLREHGCPWDLWTCLKAAEGGHLEILK